MRGWLPLVVVLACAHGARADDRPSTRETLRARLSSHDAADVAWALHDAIETKATDLDDEIRRVLTTPPPFGSLAHAVRTEAIDAAIELSVALPDDLLRSLAAGTDVARGLTLASRNPLVCRDSLRAVLSARTEDDTWRAACNLLLPLRDRVLVGHLLSRLRLEVHLDTCDPGDKEIHRRGGYGSMRGIGCARVEKPDLEGWPPRSCWRLTRSTDLHTRLVAAGSTPIYAYRCTLRTGDFLCSSMPSDEAHASCEYVADLLNVRVDAIRSALHEYATIEFVDDASWLRSADAARAAVLRRWLAVIAWTVREGLLGLRQAFALRPDLRFQPADHRTGKHPPLVLPAGWGRVGR